MIVKKDRHCPEFPRVTVEKYC